MDGKFEIFYAKQTVEKKVEAPVTQPTVAAPRIVESMRAHFDMARQMQRQLTQENKWTSRYDI